MHEKVWKKNIMNRIVGLNVFGYVTTSMLLKYQHCERNNFLMSFILFSFMGGNVSIYEKNIR